MKKNESNSLGEDNPSPRSTESDHEVASRLVTVTDESFQDVSNKFPRLIVLFRTDQCRSCEVMETVLGELVEEVSDKTFIGNLDMDQNPRTPKMFQVSHSPTLLIMEKRNVLDKIVGTISMQELENRLRESFDIY